MVDYWQVLGSIAALIFSVGFVDQLRVTWVTKNVDGISLFQWCVFTIASGIFTAYYVHLSQWLMVTVSFLSTICCLLIVVMILKYRNTD